MHMIKSSPGWGRSEGLLRGGIGSLNPEKERTQASETSLNLMHPVFTAAVNRLISQRPNKALINCSCIHSHRGDAHPGLPPPPRTSYFLCLPQNETALFMFCFVISAIKANAIYGANYSTAACLVLRFTFSPHVDCKEAPREGWSTQFFFFFRGLNSISALFYLCIHLCIFHSAITWWRVMSGSCTLPVPVWKQSTAADVHHAGALAKSHKSCSWPAEKNI